MARPTNANLELAKARKSNGALELNPAHVVRLLGVLQAVASGPKLAAEVAIIHPATLASTPVPRMQAAALLGQQGQLVATSPAPTANIQARVVIEASMASTLHPVIPRFEAEYDINVFRGPSHQVADDWQLAGELTDAVAESWEVAANQRVTLTGDWQEAVADHSQVGWSIDQAPRCYQLGGSDWQEGQALGAHHGQPMESLPPGHVQVAGLWVEGAASSQWHLSGYTHPPRGDVAWDVRWQEAVRLGLLLVGDWQLGDQLHLGWLDGWDEAIWPPPGTSPPPKPPIKPEKPEKRRLRLAFGRPRGDASLEFVWFGQDAAYVIPTRRVYLVSNTASVVRVRDGLDIPATAVNIELDTDSWAWQFSAQIPRIAAAALTDDEEVSIHINGEQWDCVCDGWQSSESFGRQSATLTGRSRTAYLSPTHVLPQAVGEGSTATMQQLAASLLPYGWTLEWQAADWLVPGGFFSLDGQTPIEAIKYLAEAAGGFVLPHQRNQHLVIKPRYPTVPWQLDTAQAEVAIPRAIITTLGSDFQPGQAANGIYVSGGHQGITGRVLRQGTAGERQAPTITHPLVCDVVAARAQGVVGLARTMPRRTQTIELPLSSDTGLILPGALLAVDSWKGYNRGVRVSAGVQGRAMTVRQQLSVERFV
ncbi:hypothetical protein AHGSH82_024930 [Aeromonas hydrophila]|uniref:hypothetical protein n=1 Tax=Aeromonas hydrophila TaxID=644 RepID=UPI00101AF92B|nr:hypothetical protein [Aeromonas hydrophila]BBG85348.1 hypothetical protein AHGSH82_024930 [Aeromonas hydrophila]BBT62652.1 hypothetical protein WP8S18E02_24490 [Aeromonas hydrophila]